LRIGRLNLLLCLVSEASGRRAPGTLASRRKREIIGKDGDIKSSGQASKEPFTLGISQAAESKKATFERVFVHLSHNNFLTLVLILRS
jgi:hypothetical protein